MKMWWALLTTRSSIDSATTALGNSGCDHLNRPHRDHLNWPHLASSKGGVHQLLTGGLDPCAYGKEVEGGIVRADPKGQRRA
jgi:hypothetical protein